MNKAAYWKTVEENIARYGYQLTIASGGQVPRFAYTIDRANSGQPDLLMAGCSVFLLKDVKRIVETTKQLLETGQVEEGAAFAIEEFGKFSLRPVHPSWQKGLLTGCLYLYRMETTPAYQIVPEKNFWTIDTPDTVLAYDPEAHVVWKYLYQEWDQPQPITSTVLTNLITLKGGYISELVRVDKDEWEMFYGPGSAVAEADIRIVPIWTLLGHDPSLARGVNLPVNGGLYRETRNGPWMV